MLIQRLIQNPDIHLDQASVSDIDSDQDRSEIPLEKHKEALCASDERGGWEAEGGEATEDEDEWGFGIADDI